MYHWVGMAPLVDLQIVDLYRPQLVIIGVRSSNCPKLVLGGDKSWADSTHPHRGESAHLGSNLLIFHINYIGHLLLRRIKDLEEATCCPIPISSAKEHLAVEDWTEV